VQRVVILGPGGAGKSTLAKRLGVLLDLPVVELDRHFWGPDLQPMSKEEWRTVQASLTQPAGWIMDGDLGPYDVVQPRLQRADTVVVLDFARWRCVWRSARRSRQRLDYWRWLWTWRTKSRPQLLSAIAAHAGQAKIKLLRSPAAVQRWLAEIKRD
jgi:adenylate kinase family enzyme